jgi:N-methylhydantoinase A/acetophenone carboxylase
METTIDIDTGGTFTDGTVRRNDKVRTLKTVTTPHDLTVCFSEIIEQAAALFDSGVREFLTTVDCIRYSTTIGTNAVIERNGADVGVLAESDSLSALGDNGELLVDILEQGEQRQLEGATDSREIAQRYNELAEELSDNIAVGMESLEAERTVREVLLEEQPRHYLGSVPLHLSWELTSDPDDERRLATTLVDAYLHPALGDFLYKAEDFLRDHGYDSQLLVFCSDGTSTRVAKTTAIRTYNSGPSAGIQGAAEIAGLYDTDDAVALDIGGTSADIALIQDGNIEREEFGEVGDVELSFPMRKLFPVGGGGGTIASIEGDDLSLGPESAGSNPGPACYGLGGRQPTVTDADVVSGIMAPGFFAGDEISLDADRAEQVIESELADPLGISVEKAAYLVRDRLEAQIGGFVSETLANENIAPENTSLVVYGGAGPAHACGVARHAGIGQVVIPSNPSVFSAHSVGFSDVVHDYHYRVADSDDLNRVDDAISRFRQRGRHDMEGEGFSPEETEFTWTLGGIDGEDAVELGETAPADAESDIATHLDDYDQVVLTLTAEAALPTHTFVPRHTSAGDLTPVEETEIQWYSADGRVADLTPVYDYREIDGQVASEGPAVLRDTSTTYAVPPDWQFEVNEYGHMIVSEAEYGE